MCTMRDPCVSRTGHSSQGNKCGCASMLLRLPHSNSDRLRRFVAPTSEHGDEPAGTCAAHQPCARRSPAARRAPGRPCSLRRPAERELLARLGMALTRSAMHMCNVEHAMSWVLVTFLLAARRGAPTVRRLRDEVIVHPQSIPRMLLPPRIRLQAPGCCLVSTTQLLSKQRQHACPRQQRLGAQLTAQYKRHACESAMQWCAW